MNSTGATYHTAHRILIIMLRIGGGLCCTAILACVMPTSWIVAAHKWAGLGDFPDAPITQYLARSISGLYVIIGAFAIFISTDLPRYAPILRFYAYVTVGFGFLMLGIDSGIGMPTSWTIFEGPPTIVLGVVILLLARGVDRCYSSSS